MLRIEEEKVGMSRILQTVWSQTGMKSMVKHDLFLFQLLWNTQWISVQNIISSLLRTAAYPVLEVFLESLDFLLMDDPFMEVTAVDDEKDTVDPRCILPVLWLFPRWYSWLRGGSRARYNLIPSPYLVDRKANVCLGATGYSPPLRVLTVFHLSKWCRTDWRTSAFMKQYRTATENPCEHKSK